MARVLEKQKLTSRHHEWTPEELQRLVDLHQDGTSIASIAQRLDIPERSLIVKIAVIKRAMRWGHDAYVACLRDEQERERSRKTTSYRLLEPLTDDEAFALGLCLPEAERHAKLFGVSESFATAIAKIEQAVGAR